MLLAVAQQVGVDELGAVVRVQPQQGEGQRLAHGGDGGGDRLLGAVEQGDALRPGGMNIGQYQRMQVFSRGGRAAVSHQVHLLEAGAGLIPVREGADGDLALEQRPRLGGAQAAAPQALALPA